MSCYGGIPVTLETCKDICSCENGHISCPTYKYCDDSTMDTFCGGMCGCSSNTLPSDLRADNDDRNDEIMLGSHRYPPTSQRGMDDADDEADDDEEDEDDYEDDDDSMVKRRATRAVENSTPPASELL
jgi:hypothetical protein